MVLPESPSGEAVIRRNRFVLHFVATPPIFSRKEEGVIAADSLFSIFGKA